VDDSLTSCCIVRNILTRFNYKDALEVEANNYILKLFTLSVLKEKLEDTLG